MSEAPAAAAVLDPHEIDVGEGTYRFRSDPLDAPRRALLAGRDHINGNPLDWALGVDPSLDDTLLAVRSHPPGFDTPLPLRAVCWFAVDRRLRAESFHSPIMTRDWRPDLSLVRRLLQQTPYVVIAREDDVVRHAVDLRSVAEPRTFAAILRGAGDAVLPATGGLATTAGEIPAIVAHVPYAGDRYARSTRKRFRLNEPSLHGESVEGVAARILTAHGYRVETPRLLVALYRLLVHEVVAHWWHDPLRIETNGASAHHAPGANPLAATRRGEDAIAAVACGAAGDEVRRIGSAVIAARKRPPEYARYVERLARLSESLGAGPLAGILEGMLRGHEAHRADLVAAHPGTGQGLLVEVKSTGDRLRPTQAEAALWHQRDARAGYRVMRIEHPRAAT